MLISPRLDSKVDPNTNYTPDADRERSAHRPSFLIQAAGKSAPYMVVGEHPLGTSSRYNSQVRTDSLTGELHPQGTGDPVLFPTLLSCGSCMDSGKERQNWGTKPQDFQGETTGRGKLRHRKKELSKTVNSGTAAVSHAAAPKEYVRGLPAESRVYC